MNRLKYHEYRADGIFGDFTFANDDHPFMVTLSHAYEQPDAKYAPIVLPGIYTCKRGWHTLADGVPFETFEITGVAGHAGLLFHAGNFNKDSHGCTLCGMSEIAQGDGEWMITRSKDTFRAWMARLEHVQTFQLEVIG
ncbi:MAG: hypothetical protein HKM00_02990 [Gallionella sp.]|nr:hypothetical protein [Gallionella sp.]